LTSSTDWDAVLAEAADFLSAYVRINSAHPEGNTEATAAHLAKKLDDERVEYKIYKSDAPGKVNLVARLRADNSVGKPLLMSHHMDVVPCNPADWSFEPFSGDIANGYIYGRGAMDDKGMGVMELMALLLLKRNRVKLNRDVLLMATCDEEIGSTMGAKWMCENHFADLDPAFMLDEGGNGLRGFFAVGDVFKVAVGEKRACRFKMIARAEPGHGSMPWDDAAPHRLVRAAQRLLSQPPEDRDCGPIGEMIRRLGGNAAREEMKRFRATQPLLHDTVSLTIMSGGYKVNIIPEQAEMSFDCRLLPDTDEQAFISNVQQLINDPAIKLEVDWPTNKAVMAPWNTGLFSAIEQSCGALTPQVRVAPTICGGGTDSRFFRDRGVPAYGFMPAIFTADEVKGIHGIDERMSLDNLKLGCQLTLDIAARVSTI
jgi:acetylornithine deacetylase/succinyl-diaminopimelate desuccinylase-like protein